MPARAVSVAGPTTGSSCKGVVRRLLTLDGIRLDVAEKDAGALAPPKHDSGFALAPYDPAMPMPECVGRCAAPRAREPRSPYDREDRARFVVPLGQCLAASGSPDVDRSIRGNHAGLAFGLGCQPRSLQGLYKSLRRSLPCWSNISIGKNTCTSKYKYLHARRRNDDCTGPPWPPFIGCPPLKLPGGALSLQPVRCAPVRNAKDSRGRQSASSAHRKPELIRLDLREKSGFQYDEQGRERPV
jgi:hypothetical protein